ncbi:MAG: polysaccharide deacetylase family protein [Candidatus Moranbacteria bacterium]|nr:polysaccharide deacetylase family protein [Candidatus Moranbacteria bacterium]
MKKMLLILIAVLFLSGCQAKETVQVETIESSSVSGKDPADLKYSEPDAPVQQEEKEPEAPSGNLVPSGNIPVLMYHYIRSVDKDEDFLGYNLSTDPELFKQEMEWLKNNGYSAITPSMAIKGDVPEKSVILTFDDGYSDFYDAAFPILKSNGFRASEAIIIDKIDHSGFMMGTQLKEISDYGIELMSHSMTHPNLKESTDERLRAEIKDSRDFLEYHYDIKVPFFVYPSGDYNEKIQGYLKENGYSGAFTTEPGIADFKGNLFDLKRIRIDNRNSLEDFKNKILNSKN